MNWSLKSNSRPKVKYTIKSGHYSDVDSLNDDFYDRVEEYLTKLTVPTQEDSVIEKSPQHNIQVSEYF